MLTTLRLLQNNVAHKHLNLCSQNLMIEHKKRIFVSIKAVIYDY